MPARAPALLLLLCATCLAAAEGALVGIDGLILPVSAPRAGMPILAELRLSTRLGVREGRAVVVLATDDAEKARWEGPVWRIGTTLTAFRVLLPPARDWTNDDDLRADLLWQEDGVTYSLGRMVVARAGPARLAVAELTIPGQEVARALAILPPSTHEDAPVRPTTMVARLDPEQAPLSAEGWMAWDAVLLHPQTALPPAVGSALTAWLLAGGRLVVAPGASGPEVGAMLEDLRSAASYQGRGPGWTRIDAGLGRVLLAAPGGEPAKIAEALWNRPDVAVEAGIMGWNGPRHRSDPGFQELLWPEEVGRVPLVLIFLVFAGFLIWVGPVEWFILGRLRRRRWTWVTYPLAAVATTVVVTLIARGAFGSADHVRRLVVIDCDAAGTPRRSSVIEQRFAGGDRVLREQPAGELVMPLGNGRTVYRGEDHDEPVALRAVHRGPWHAGGEVEVLLPQWTPVLLRRLSCHLPAAVQAIRLGPAPGSIAAAEAGLEADLTDGWEFAVVLPAGKIAGDPFKVFSSSKRAEPYYAGNPTLWLSLREVLTTGSVPTFADLAWSRPARLFARRQGADIIIWRQVLPTTGEAP